MNTVATPRPSSWVAAALLATVSATVPAQSLIQVDRFNSPGTSFTTVEPAIAAAQPGDTVLILPGTYSVGSVEVNKGISIVGRGNPTLLALPIEGRAFRLSNLSAAETFAMRGINISGTILRTDIAIENCAGKVFLRDLLITGSSGSIVVSGSTQVILEGCTAQRGVPGLQAIDSEVTANGCEFRSTTGFGVVNQNSTLELIECTVSGGGVLVGNPGINMMSGSVRLAGGRVDAGTGLAATPTSAIATASGSSLQLSPTADLNSTAGAPNVSGFASVSNVDFPTATSAQTPLTVTIAGAGTPGDSYALILTLPPIAKLPTPFGEFWIDPAVNLVVGSGVFPPSRDVSAALSTGAAEPGLVVLAQTVQIGSGSLALSNPTVMIID